MSKVTQLSEKQISALETIHTHTSQVGIVVMVNLNSLSGSVDASIPTTKSILLSLQTKNFIKVLDELKNESVKLILTNQGAAYKTLDIEVVAEDRPVKPVELQRALEALSSGEQIAPIQPKVPKEKKKPTVKAEKEESVDEDGNPCPKLGSKSFMIYDMLREGKVSKEIVKAMVGKVPTKTYPSEVDRIKDKYHIKPKTTVINS